MCDGLPEVIDFQGARWVRNDVVQELEQRLAAAEARCASDHSGDGTDMTDKWATSLTESDVLNLRGIIAELRDMPANNRESFRLQAFATRIEKML
jgi:hypothetical protein